jgi:hypothetical protein
MADWTHARDGAQAVTIDAGRTLLVVGHVADHPAHSVQYVTFDGQPHSHRTPPPQLKYARTRPSMSMVRVADSTDMVFVCGCDFGESNCENTCETLLVKSVPPTNDNEDADGSEKGGTGLLYVPCRQDNGQL